MRGAREAVPPFLAILSIFCIVYVDAPFSNENPTREQP